MKEQFVTYEIALKLKELGFDDPCLAYFSNDKYHDLHHSCENVMEGNFVINNYNELKTPLWQQVIDWFRDEKFINIEIIRFPNINKWGFITTNMNIIPKYLSDEEMIIYNNLVTSPNRYDTYEDAKVAAILKVINIIEDEVWSNLGEVPANS